jgi:hypothetical protein
VVGAGACLQFATFKKIDFMEAERPGSRFRNAF